MYILITICFTTIIIIQFIVYGYNKVEIYSPKKKLLKYSKVGKYELF